MHAHILAEPNESAPAVDLGASVTRGPPVEKPGLESPFAEQLKLFSVFPARPGQWKKDKGTDRVLCTFVGMFANVAP